MKNVPVIDVSELATDRDALRELDGACRHWGFFQVVGHGVDPQLRDRLLACARQFFAQPKTDKYAVIRTSTNVWGYYDRELTKNTRDWKEIFDVGAPESDGPLAGAVPQWPVAPADFRGTVLEYMDACRAVGHRLLAAISRNLGMPADYLGTAFDGPDSSFLRLNYYPICSDPASADAPTRPTHGYLGINRHTDAGALTVLLQDSQPGLQVCRQGQWSTIEPVADAFVINIGDIVQVWSNDRYEAPLHRVIANDSAPRYSAACFFNPAYATNYAPLPSVCDQGHPPRYRSINWGEFRAGRAAGDYADYGEEIQISQFRI